MVPKASAPSTKKPAKSTKKAAAKPAKRASKAKAPVGEWTEVHDEDDAPAAPPARMPPPPTHVAALAVQRAEAPVAPPVPNGGRDAFAVAAVVAAAVGAVFGLVFFGLGHSAIDSLSGPDKGEARTFYSITAVVGLAGGGLGIAGAARRWMVSLAATLPTAGLLALWATAAASSYATASHCGGDAPADNPELMLPLTVVLVLVAIAGGVLAIVKLVATPRDQAKAGALGGVLMGPIGLGLGVAAIIHLSRVGREAAESSREWAQWQVIENDACGIPGPGMVLVVLAIAVALVGAVWLRARSD